VQGCSGSPCPTILRQPGPGNSCSRELGCSLTIINCGLNFCCSSKQHRSHLRIAVPWPLIVPSHEDAAAGMKASLLRARPRLLRQLLSRSALRKLLVLLLVWSVVEAQLVYYRIARAQREFETQDTVLQKPKPRIFIASLHWNNAGILRSDWNGGVLDIVDAFGPENVFVSVYESGSWDDSKGALRELDIELEKTGVGKRITLDDATHEDLIKSIHNDEGWITVRSGELAGQRAPRRIPYLSRLRNLTLQPLLDMAKNGTTFDYVLFLGDVVFSVSFSWFLFSCGCSPLMTARYPTSLDS